MTAATSLITNVVLDCRRGDLGYYVIVRDDRDAYELFRTPGQYVTLEAAAHAASQELEPNMHVVDVLEVQEG